MDKSGPLRKVQTFEFIVSAFSLIQPYLKLLTRNYLVGLSFFLSPFGGQSLAEILMRSKPGKKKKKKWASRLEERRGSGHRESIAVHPIN